jgi:DNA-binding MarR family transcriptional regulator
MSTSAPAKPVPRDFGVLLNLAFGAFKQELHAELARVGFDDVGPSFGYVFRLLAHKPTNLRDVAQALCITAPGALKIVNDMVDKGYVERQEHPGDARQKLLTLTPRARQAMAAAHEFHEAFERALATRIGPRQVSAARAVLEAIVASAERDNGEIEIALRSR